ncbi:hypothetical protein FHS57_005094 [Runella defluvii]|uniref:Uncharacterized protein n=1 Tax=Runella defluvii TaxID=370973 RepID=A0A7W5ZQ78_9BACT|nr:hypothetical protein [Runella defluvii]MBB3841073.1 hypothetical protein [Runella defluvii]
MRVFSTLSVVFIICLASCSKRIYVTPNQLSEWTNDGVDIKKLQYLNTRGFEWETRNQTKNVDIKSGELQVKKQNVVNKIFVRANTMGVLDKYIEDSNEMFIGLYLSFDKDEPPLYFTSVNPWTAFEYKLDGDVKTILYVLSSDVNKYKYNKKRLKGVKVQ